MSETPSSEDLERKRLILSEALRSCGISIPESPLYDTSVLQPRAWLVRGENRKDRLIDQGKRTFAPQSGEMGTYGVFFGDCLKPLIYPQNGLFYIYGRNDVADTWLVDPSTAYKEEYANAALQHNLNPTSISEGIVAQEWVYRQHNVYQAKRGIATVASPLPLDQSAAIIMTDGFLSQDELHHLPPSLSSKLTTLKY